MLDQTGRLVFCFGLRVAFFFFGGGFREAGQGRGRRFIRLSGKGRRQAAGAGSSARRELRGAFFRGDVRRRETRGESRRELTSKFPPASGALLPARCQLLPLLFLGRVPLLK